jgi:hypothetical protein
VWPRGLVACPGGQVGVSFRKLQQFGRSPRCVVSVEGSFEFPVGAVFDHVVVAAEGARLALQVGPPWAWARRWSRSQV